MTATGESMVEFATPAGETVTRRLPVIHFAQAAEGGNFDAKGRPTSKGWSEAPFSLISDSNAFALEISGDAFEPTYRDEDTIVVSPSTNVRRGDRMVIKPQKGAVMLGRLVRESAYEVELTLLSKPYRPRTIERDELAWMARIVWASQ